MTRNAADDRQESAEAVKQGRAVRGQAGRRERMEDQALAALLSEPTILKAAAKAGVSESTMLRWMAEPDFKARYREARRQLVEQAVSTLQQATGEAVDALRRNLTCGIPAAEISAAKAIVEQSIKAVELVDLAERVDQLELTLTEKPRKDDQRT